METQNIHQVTPTNDHKTNQWGFVFSRAAKLFATEGFQCLIDLKANPAGASREPAARWVLHDF